MSGMKFRVQCSACGVTFFSPDRKARICPKCMKKRQGIQSGKELRPSNGPASRTASEGNKRPAAPKLAPPKPKKEQRKPKASEITPDQIERLGQIYLERFAGTDQPWVDMVKAISDELLVNRRAVSSRLRRIVHPDVEITPELRSEIIRRYQTYVEHNERPAEGRRKTISMELGIPYTQVRNIVYEWSQAQFKQSPTPELSRDLRFEIEKLYWGEIDAQRLKLDDIPAEVASRMGTVNTYQVSRWLDTLHDDDARFEGVSDVSPEIEQKIVEAYKQYLMASTTPEKGLHATIAEKIGGITTRQVHKTLQKYRKQRRRAYPLL